LKHQRGDDPAMTSPISILPRLLAISFEWWAESSCSIASPAC